MSYIDVFVLFVLFVCFITFIHISLKGRQQQNILKTGVICLVFIFARLNRV